jgi:hypothetical protein
MSTRSTSRDRSTTLERSLPDDLLNQQRAMIDLIATLRTRVVRSAYAGQVTARPDPVSARDADRMAGRVAALADQVVDLQRIVSLLRGKDPTREFTEVACTWLAESAADQPGMLRQLQKIVPALQKLYERAADHIAAPAESKSTEPLDNAIKSFIESSVGFHEVVTDFCDRLWRRLDEERRADLAAAERTRQAIGATLAKLEKIGKHVRLVSLNASVEASRAGDAGKGLAVIAVEFKSLAEEIQGLAASAREEMESMQ